MLKLIRYFFFRIYSFSVSQGQQDAGWAMTIVAIFGILNVYGILGIIQIIFGIATPQLNKWWIIALSAILIYFYYSLLIKGGRAKAILAEFGEKKDRKGKLNLLLLVYAICTITIFVYVGSVVREMNQ